MNKRIFIAISISPALQEIILQWENNLSNLPVRWLKGKNLHITIIPPWYESDVDSVIKKLKSMEGKTGAIELTFQRVTYGPDTLYPRLLWGEGKTPPQLPILRNEMSKKLGQKEEKRPFLLHLTLARFRPEDFRNFPVKTLDETVSWKETVRSLVLMESKLSPAGAEYEPLATINL
jgi:2'-5' RNA ligase